MVEKLTAVEVKHSSSADVLNVIWGALSVHLKRGDECLLTDSGVDGESSHCIQIRSKVVVGVMRDERY